MSWLHSILPKCTGLVNLKYKFSHYLPTLMLQQTGLMFTHTHKEKIKNSICHNTSQELVQQNLKYCTSITDFFYGDLHSFLNLKTSIFRNLFTEHHNPVSLSLCFTKSHAGLGQHEENYDNSISFLLCKIPLKRELIH